MSGFVDLTDLMAPPIVDLTDLMSPAPVDLTDLCVETTPSLDAPLKVRAEGDQNPYYLRRGKKLKRDVHSEFWDAPVLAAERHVDFRSIDRLHRHAQNQLAGILKGKNRARIIRTVAMQAIEQVKKKKRPSEFTFAHDAGLEAEIRGHVERVYRQARKLVRLEVSRALGARRKR